MKFVCFGSPKGGVGKTMLTANIAYALQRLGMNVVVIDFDPQNALRHHFGISLEDGRGYVSSCLSTDDWRPFLRETRSGVRLLVYGDATHEERRRFDMTLEQNPNFLVERLRPLLFGEPNAVLLADMPPGPSPALEAYCRLNPLCVAVLLADTASTALLPAIERGEFFGPNAIGRTFYVVNQYDIRSALNRDVSAFLRERLGAALLGLVHRDEAVKEAHARQISVFQHAYASAAVEDLTNIARNIQRLLSVGDGIEEQQQAPFFSSPHW
jgi:cellulose synthase operon protein YhjQ